MCMYRNIPELIQAGVHSFKIEGRMRTPDFVSRIVRTYRKAIDSYIADPTGYSVDEKDWQDLYDNRSRDFTTCFALGQPGKKDIGFSGEREPRFFSQAVKEADLKAGILDRELPIQAENTAHRQLSVRVANLAAAKAACESGADTIYIGGEAFKPQRPWTLADIQTAIKIAETTNTKVVVLTPRTTMRRECGELEQFFAELMKIRPAGIIPNRHKLLKRSFRILYRIKRLNRYSTTAFSLTGHYLGIRFLNICTVWQHNSCQLTSYLRRVNTSLKSLTTEFRHQSAVINMCMISAILRTSSITMRKFSGVSD